MASNFLQNIVSGLSSGVQGYQGAQNMMQQRKAQELANQQRGIQLQAIVDKQERDKAFRQDFQDMGYTQGASDPRELQDLYMEHYPEQVAQQQLKQLGRGGNQAVWIGIPGRPGWKRNKVTGEEVFNPEVQASVTPEQKAKMSYQKNRISNMESKLKLAEKGNDQKVVKTLKDQIFREKQYQQQEEEIEFKQNWARNKTPYEYAQKQTQLAGQIPSMLQDSYRGTMIQGGQGAQDLTPQAVKDIVGATEGASKILRSTENLIDMVNDEGLALLPGKRKAKMETLISDMALTYKGVDFAGLGVLTGPDLDILVNIMGDPTSFAGLNASIQQEKLNEFRNLLLAGYNKKLDARGFNPISPGQILGVGGKKTTLSSEDEALID